MSKTKSVVNGKIVGKVNAMEYVEKNGYPEVGGFEDKKALQKFYKQLDTEQLQAWIDLEGLEYKKDENESITRMRMCMAILYKHFPRTSKPKKESPYKKYTTEDLVQMAVEHEVAVEATDDMRILRMRLIMNLRAAKVIGE